MKEDVISTKYLRKTSFNYQELDLPNDHKDAKWIINRDWLWNQKVDQIFDSHSLKIYVDGIWDYQIDLFESPIFALRVKINFLNRRTLYTTTTGIVEFEIIGFSK